ncbi:MAG: 2TM domain-containing protein [Candidatus Chryseobacterium colombiense]|nr:2TM domain-containing protein [Chryseobacterium sp.]WEK68855.1 MAG: 2TM domain-containing protein [Chryseobacterium sp.]
MTHINENDSRYKEAEKRVKKIKGFYVHLMIYCFTNLLVIALQLFDADDKEKLSWNLLQLPLFWGIGLAAHGLSVFLPPFMLGKGWEERKIKELMDKEK